MFVFGRLIFSSRTIELRRKPKKLAVEKKIKKIPIWNGLNSRRCSIKVVIPSGIKKKRAEISLAKSGYGRVRSCRFKGNGLSP